MTISIDHAGSTGCITVIYLVAAVTFRSTCRRFRRSGVKGCFSASGSGTVFTNSHNVDSTVPARPRSTPVTCSSAGKVCLSVQTERCRRFSRCDGAAPHGGPGGTRWGQPVRQGESLSAVSMKCGSQAVMYTMHTQRTFTMFGHTAPHRPAVNRSFGYISVAVTVESNGWNNMRDDLSSCTHTLPLIPGG